MSERLHKLFAERTRILSVYMTAGFPALDDTVPVLQALQSAGVDLIEIGIPFSDPVADGPTIQRSSDRALKNGMTLEKLFAQLKDIRKSVSVPLMLMGYINPVLQYGVERFCAEAAACGVDGVIIPDLPMEEYLRHFQEIFNRYGLANTFLVTSRTVPERVAEIDRHSKGFIYLVSSDATTGGALPADAEIEKYFERIAALKLRSPLVVGFGISDRRSFARAVQYANGAIIGSAFIRLLDECGAVDASRIAEFVRTLRS